MPAPLRFRDCRVTSGIRLATFYACFALAPSNFINKGGRKRKSASNANAIVTELNRPMSELTLKLDVARTPNPITNVIEVMHRATPTVRKA